MASAQSLRARKPDPEPSFVPNDTPKSTSPPVQMQPTRPQLEPDADVANANGSTMPNAPPPPPPSASSTIPQSASPQITQAKAKPSKPPTDTVPVLKEPQSLDERRAEFHELRSYEAKRRSIYTSKLKSTEIYWRAFRDMMSKSYEETDRAENIVRGTLVANEAYANYLKASADDRIDYAGKPVDMRRGQSLKLDRMKKYNNLSGGSFYYGKELGKDEKLEKKQENNNTSLEKSMELMNTSTASFDGLPEDTVLAPLINAQLEMADAFLENINFVKDVTLTKITGLRKELEIEVSTLGALGDSTVFELKRAEEDVQKKWSAYYKLAAMIDMDFNAARKQKMNGKGSMNANTVTDVWLLEMQYRMSVAFLTTAWEKSSKELSTLFAGVKEVECNRRFRLRELLVLFMERAQKMWGAVPPLMDTVVEDLDATTADIKGFEKEVSEEIRAKAQELQSNGEGNIIQTDNEDPMNDPGLTGVPEIDKGFELQSPLLSGLLCKIDVIWRKSDKMMSVWKPCLAATTSDNYLHLFEIPPNANVITHTKPDEAFQSLVPPVVVPTEESIVEGTALNTEAWFNHLVPGVSFDLKNSSISFNPQMGNSTFELSETLQGQTGFATRERKKVRKYSMRLNSSEEMVGWLLALRNLGAS